MLALFNLDGTGDENHVVNAPALAASTAADVGFIGFDMFSGVAANPILVGAHHTGSQFVKNLESRLITRQSELPLELDGRHAGRLAGDQVGCPEPHRERCVRALHDGASREVAIMLAVATSQNGWAIGETIGIAGRSATGTDEPVAPSCALKVAAHAASSGKRRWNSGSERGNSRSPRLSTSITMVAPRQHRCSKYYRLWVWVTTG